jgi:hypothetical protein
MRLLKSRIDYWSNSRLANWVRGENKPYALEWHKWDEWKKEQKKKDKQQARSVSFAPDPRRPVSEPQQTPVRNTIDYEPPNAFLQTLQRPLPEKKNNILADLWNFN